MTKTSKFNKLAGTFVFAIVMFAMTAVVYAGAQSEYQTYSRNLAFDIDYLNSLSNEEILTLISCRIDVLNSLNEEFGTDLAFICIYEYGNRAIIIHTLATQSLSEYEYKNRELALSIATARDAVVIFDAVFYSDFTDSQLLEIIYAVEYGYVDIRQMRALIDYGYDVAELFNDYIDNTIFSVPTIQQNIVQHRNGWRSVMVVLHSRVIGTMPYIGGHIHWVYSYVFGVDTDDSSTQISFTLTSSSWQLTSNNTVANARAYGTFRDGSTTGNATVLATFNASQHW